MTRTALTVAIAVTVGAIFGLILGAWTIAYAHDPSECPTPTPCPVCIAPPTPEQAAAMAKALQAIQAADAP